MRLFGDNMKFEHLIPADILERVSKLRVIDAGFGAGPSCIAGMGHSFDPPVSFEEGMAWLEQYFNSLRRGHLRFVDGTTLWFDSTGFDRYDEEVSDELPRPGVVVPTTD